MRKLKLDLAELDVTSFDLDQTLGRAGTVAANVTKQPTYDIECESGGTCNEPGCTNPSGGFYTCADFSCIQDSGCGLCYSESCDVTNCTCVGVC